MIAQQTAVHESLTLSERARLIRNIEQLQHVRQNLTGLGFVQAAILIQRAVESLEGL